MPKSSKSKAKADEVKPVIIQATGAASKARAPGLGNAIEKAMSRAILQAYADGLGEDPDAIKACMLAAREEVKAKAAD